MLGMLKVVKVVGVWLLAALACVVWGLIFPLGLLAAVGLGVIDFGRQQRKTDPH